MTTEIFLAIIGTLLGVLALIATYHIAFRQGIFKKNKIYLNVITPFFDDKVYPAKSDLVLYGIPKQKINSVFLIMLPIYIENRSKEALRNVRIVIAHDEKLNASWARNQFPSELQKEIGVSRDYVIHNYLNTEYLMDIMRIDQRTVLTHLISFDDENLSEGSKINEQLQKTISKNSGYNSYLTDVMIAISAENIREIKFKTPILITGYDIEWDFLNKQSQELANEYFVNTITINPKDYLTRYISQIIDKGISTKVFVNMPKFEHQGIKGHPVFMENFEVPSYGWWEKRYKVISPLTLMTENRKYKKKKNSGD